MFKFRRSSARRCETCMGLPASPGSKLALFPKLAMFSIVMVALLMPLCASKEAKHAVFVAKGQWRASSLQKCKGKNDKLFDPGEYADRSDMEIVGAKRLDRLRIGGCKCHAEPAGPLYSMTWRHCWVKYCRGETEKHTPFHRVRNEVFQKDGKPSICIYANHNCAARALYPQEIDCLQRVHLFGSGLVYRDSWLLKTPEELSCLEH